MKNTPDSRLREHFSFTRHLQYSQLCRKYPSLSPESFEVIFLTMLAMCAFWLVSRGQPQPNEQIWFVDLRSIGDSLFCRSNYGEDLAENEISSNCCPKLITVYILAYKSHPEFSGQDMVFFECRTYKSQQIFTSAEHSWEILTIKCLPTISGFWSTFSQILLARQIGSVS